ncbi:MAG: CIA30 family protein [Chlorobium sp.]|nr:CIA30 family protein [Chlorobium phaeovibrioides]NQU46736.1 CIA30 family protein [Chlorobium sp.]
MAELNKHSGGVPDRVICDFTRQDCQQWFSVSDKVMGGVSESLFFRRDDGIGVFQGVLSTANGGGFAAVRTLLGERDFSGFSGIGLRVKGDGRRYSFRIRNDDQYDGIVYRYEFDTVAGRWLEIDLPFSGFTASFRGRTIDDAAPLDLSSIVQIGFMVSKEKSGAYLLEVQSIKACPAPQDAFRA